MSSKRVVIIGAGPGGLATAILLARGGVRVTLLERLPVPGGRCSSFQLDGHTFDLGPTFFLYPRVLGKILGTVGRRLADEIEMVRLDPQYRLDFGAAGHIDARPDPAWMEREIARIAPDDAPGFRRFLDDNRHKLASFRPILERPFLSWTSLLSWDLIKLLPLVRPWRSLDTELGRYFSDERVRLAFTFQSKYLGMSPFQCPSLFSILSFLEYEHGVWHPTGGCGAVSAMMARVCEQEGVDVRLGDEVTGIEFEGRRPVAVHASASGRIGCDALVINADFARAMRRLVPDELRRRWTDRRMDRKQFSCSTFMLWLGVRGRVPELPHHTIHLAEDYRRNLDDIESAHVLSARPSFYVQNPCVTDPTLAPPGDSSLYILAPVTHQHENVDWSRETAGFRARVLSEVAKLGIPDLESRIKTERVLTPDGWAGQYEVHRGATFNLAHNLMQMLHLRPRNRFEDLESTYLVGGGTHPGSGLPVIYESACISSRLLLEDLGLDAGWLRNAVEPADYLTATAGPGRNDISRNGLVDIIGKSTPEARPQSAHAGEVAA